MNKNFVESFVEECYRAGLTELQTMVALEKSASTSIGGGLYEYGANSAEEEAAIRSLLMEYYKGNLRFSPDRDIFTDPGGIITDFLEDSAGALVNAIFDDDVYQGKQYRTNPLASTRYMINFPRNMEARRVRQRNRVYNMLRVSDDGSYHGESTDRIHARLDMGDIYNKYEKAWQAHHKFEQEITRRIAGYERMIADPNATPEQKESWEESKQTWLWQRKQNDAKLAEAKTAAEMEMALLTKQHNRSNSSPETGGTTPVMDATYDRLSSLEQKRKAIARKYQIAKGGIFKKLFNPGTTIDAWTTGTAKMEADLTHLDEQIYALRQSLNEQEEYANNVASDYGLEDMQGVHKSVHAGYSSANPDIDYSFLSPERRTRPGTASPWSGVKDRLQQLATKAQNYIRSFAGDKSTAAPVTPPASPTAEGSSETTAPVTPPVTAAGDTETTVPIKPEAEISSDSSVVPPPPADIPEDEEKLNQ